MYIMRISVKKRKIVKKTKTKKNVNNKNKKRTIKRRNRNKTTQKKGGMLSYLKSFLTHQRDPLTPPRENKKPDIKLTPLGMGVPPGMGVNSNSPLMNYGAMDMDAESSTPPQYQEIICIMRPPDQIRLRHRVTNLSTQTPNSILRSNNC